jgi:hypothetical protein
VAFTVAANTATAARSATLTIAGKAFTVTQAAAACVFTVSPLTLTLSGFADSGTISVTTQTGCTWVSASSASWITLTGSGSGNGTAAYSTALNTDTAPRTATLTVAGQTISVTQGMMTPPQAPTNLRIVR